jgi:hypothetical protein
MLLLFGLVSWCRVARAKMHGYWTAFALSLTDGGKEKVGR